MRTKVFHDRKIDKKTYFMEWFAYALVGVFVGLTTSCMSQIEAFLVHEKRIISDKIIGGADSNLVEGWLFYSGLSAVLVLVASSATVYLAPGAAGSGTPELICYLNGVNFPKFIGFNELVVKIFGVTLAVAGGLCVGKEGPLTHIGAIIGAAVAYFPLPRFEYLRNDTNKRQFIAAGCSAGVSAAFGAPIGGALFAYEISKPNTFWKFSMLWRAFFTCTIAVLSTAIFTHGLKGNPTFDVAPVELKFGGEFIESPKMDALLCACIVGVICGLLGAFFIWFNFKLLKLRKRYLTSNRLKVLEAILFALLTSSVFYWMPLAYGECLDKKLISDKNQDLLLRYDCSEG